MYKRIRYSSPHPRCKQQGAVALLIGMILFFGATLVTIFTINPVQTEQRVAANEYRSFQALNAAEAGLAHAQDFFTTFDTENDTTLCNANSLLPDENSRGGYRILRINDQPCDELDLNNDVSAYGYTTIRIEVEGWSDDQSATRVLSQSVFVINFGDGSGGPGVGGPGGLGPISFAGDVEFGAPNSNSFLVDGKGGPSISLQDPANRDNVINAINAVGRADNYTGEITGDGFGGAPWDDPNDLAAFVEAIRTTGSTNQINGDHTVGGGSQINGVNYVSGDMTFQGNGGGSGVLVVQGNLQTAGTPQFDGLIIVLGGTYTLTGGGAGGLNGSVFVSNLQGTEGNYQYGETTFNSSGGGNADFNYDLDQLIAGRDQLSEQARDLWDLEGLTEPQEPPPFLDLVDQEVYRQGLQTGIISGSWVDFQ